MIRTGRLVLRPPRLGDEDDLVREANDPLVVRHLRDRFPHPYTRDDADEWIALGAAWQSPRALAITVDGRLIGAIGAEPGADIYRLTAEVGYWLGADHWGHGYATEALAAFCDHLFAQTDYERLFATVHQGNAASMRVLEKCAFVLESVQRRAVVKRGEVLDQHLYVRLRP